MTEEILASRTTQITTSKTIYATSLVALSGILYGFMGFLGTQLLQADFSVNNMLFWRFSIAALWMWLFNLYREKKFFYLKVNWSTFLAIFCFGGIFYSGSSPFYFMGSEAIGTGLAMVIFFAYPMFIAVFSWLKDYRRVNLIALISLSMILLGLFLLKGENDHQVNTWGILLALLSALFYALYVISGKKISPRLPSSHYTFILCLSCAIIFFLISIHTHTFKIPATISTWLAAIALGIIATAIPIQLMAEGLKTISSLKASIISVLEPVVTLIVGVLLLHESVTWWQFIGVIIVTAGAILIQFSRD